MITKKLISEKGQISMEVGILVAAAVAVATVAAYYYIKSIRESGGKIEGVVIEIEGVMTNGTKDYAEKIEEVLNPGGSEPEEGEYPGGSEFTTA